jgi:hypothetical protein
MREAANAPIRVHKTSTQNQKLRTKTSKISMSQRDNRKSCHSDHYLAKFHQSSGTDYGTESLQLTVDAPRCFAYAGDGQSPAEHYLFCGRAYSRYRKPASEENVQ